MFCLTKSVHVNAPIERCFLLSTSIELVQQTIKLHPVEGKTSGLILMGDRLVWRGWKFGLPAMHETLITGYDNPHFFQDTMGRGRFSFFQHDHHFAENSSGTELRDTVRFSLPFGVAGRMIGKYIVAPHVLSLMLARFELIRRMAEGPDWERYVSPAENNATTTSKPKGKSQ